MTVEPSEEENRIASAVLDAAFKVHSALGPGLLESVYEICLMHELQKAGHHVRRQVVVPLIYDRIKLEAGLRLDLLVDECLIVECKAMDTLPPVCKSQVFTYLKLTGKRLGLLINFNVKLLRDGVERIVCSKTSPASAPIDS
jgi:GxxExxY protein